MILEKDRIELESESKLALEKVLREKIEDGKSAERLSINPDWKKLCDGLKLKTEATKNKKYELYDYYIDKALTVDEKVRAWDEIRALNFSINSVEYILAYPEGQVRLAAEAREQLEDIQNSKGEEKQNG